MISTVLVILSFALLVAVVVVLTELRERRRANRQGETLANSEAVQQPEGSADTECCGRHAVCEKNSLLSTKPEAVYYEDEELDVLAGRSADSYTEEETKAVEDVFRTLREEDVAGWLRSMQTRCIQLPDAVKEEALLIVSDRRSGQ